jgi:hypothetical protein
MKIEIFKGNWNREHVINNPDKLFIYGDNNARIGTGGQAIIRNLPNSMGLRTKKGPSKKSVAYYSDDEFDINIKNIIDDVFLIKSEAMLGRTIVFSDGGYGTGLASLGQKAPKTFKYLCFLLREHFNFDNMTGRKWCKIPGYDEITSGTHIDFEVSDIIKPLNNSYFRHDFLSKKINTTHDLIKTLNKVAFTSDKVYKNGEILIFKFKELDKNVNLVCRVIESYDISLLLSGDYKWHNFEGYDVRFNISGTEITSKYQTHFQFISTLDNEGRMVYECDIFSNTDIDISKELKKKVIGEPLPSVINKLDIKKNNEMSDDLNKINNELILIKERLDSIFTMLNKESEKSEKKRFFRRKTIYELLKDIGITGDINELNNSNYEVITNESIYYIEFKRGLFSNKINILIKKDRDVK